MANHIIFKSVIILVTMNITACGTFFSAEKNEQTALSNLSASAESVVSKAELEKMQAQMDEWEQLKPSLLRLVAIEAELKELVTQLNDMLKNQAIPQDTPALETSDPVKPVKNQSAFDDKPGQIIEATPKPIVNSPSTAVLPFAVQLYSLTDKAKLSSTWIDMLRKHPKELGDLVPLYNEVTVNGKLFYRVIAGGFSDQRAARALCDKLKLTQTPCFIAPNTGSAFL